MLFRRPPAVVAAVALLFVGLPSQAQLVRNSTTQLIAVLSQQDSDPEVGIKASTYKTVHGVVQSQQGVLPGATVWLHGSRTMVVTNAEGESNLSVPASAQTIELTCGYAGLQDEVIRLPPVQALGSVYLLRPRALASAK